MLSEELPGQVERLVDHLRKNRDSQISLTDVASVTEVLIGTMQAFFGSIDTSIYKECKSLSEYIANARTEIATLAPTEETNETGIDRAGMELDAIVQATEEATNTIMNAAEEIMGADLSSDDGQAGVQDAVMRIFEACSFQDITGQRISKVVETFTHIEARVSELSALLGVSEADILRAKTDGPVKEGDAALLSGPALEGEGIDQSEVDTLMDEFDVPSEPAPQSAESGPLVDEKKKAAPSALIDNQDDIDKLMAANPLPEVEPEPEPEPKPAVKAKEKPKPAPKPEPEDEIEKSETTSQEDIDALFS